MSSSFNRRDSSHAPYPWRGEEYPPEDSAMGDRVLIDRIRMCLRWVRGQDQVHVEQALREEYNFRGIAWLQHICAASLEISKTDVPLTDLGSEPEFVDVPQLAAGCVWVRSMRIPRTLVRKPSLS